MDIVFWTPTSALIVPATESGMAAMASQTWCAQVIDWII
jgi:hypothetical protein